MKFKQILKKAWLPALTVLAICAGAGLLAIVINGSNTTQTEQVTISSTADTTPVSKNVDTDAQVTPTAAPATAKEKTYPPTESADDFRYYLFISDEGNPDGESFMPGADALDFREAGRNAIDMLLKTFGDEFIVENPDVYVTYQAYFGRAGGGYSIAVGVTADKTGGADLGTSKFYCYMDSVSGEIYSMGKAVQTEDLGHDFDEDAAQTVYEAVDQEKLKSIAYRLIKDKFAGSRSVTDIQFNGGENIYCNGQYCILASCDMRMSEGACYKVQILYPSYDIVSVRIYPLGWHSCLFWYWDESEADEYPTLEELGEV